LLVLSETAYPGWQVSVDGDRQTALRAYTAVRAVCVPAGSHLVEWTYRPVVYKLSAAITLPALMLVSVAGMIAQRNLRMAPTPTMDDT
jgi:uncharacterized membrane protein YfhO